MNNMEASLSFGLIYNLYIKFTKLQNKKIYNMSHIGSVMEHTQSNKGGKSALEQVQSAFRLLQGTPPASADFKFSFPGQRLWFSVWFGPLIFKLNTPTAS